MDPNPVAIAHADLSDEISRGLIEALNAELSGIYSEPDTTHFHLDPAEVAAGQGAFLIVRENGTPVGCGGMRRLDDDTAELKRMFVIPAARGRGLGRQLLSALEAEARTLGVRRLVLETGIHQAAVNPRNAREKVSTRSASVSASAWAFASGSPPSET